MTDAQPDQKTREPLLSRGAVVAVAAVGLDLLVAYGVHIDDSQKTAVLAVINVLAPLALAWWARRHVTPVAKGKSS